MMKNHSLTHFGLRTALVLFGALLVVVTPAGAARKGGVGGGLPPFVPVSPAQPFLFPVSPFNIVGFIQSATVDSPGDVFSGGTVKVNGITIVVPRNTIFQLPAAAMTWGDLFANAPAAYRSLNQSGLALSDTPKPLTTYEVNVFGNRVIDSNGDRYIAGLIFMSQHSLNSGQGYINYIDYAKGEIWVGQKLGAKNGARVRINTPNGRYGKPDSNPNVDIRFTADEDNPTVRSTTGYPMCIPRFDPAVANDSLCPQWNRPKDGFTGGYETIFTMGAATADPVPDANGVTHQVGYQTGTQPVKPDPFEQAPFEIGDYVTWSGTLTADADGQYISAHTLEAELGIFTAPGTWPVYTALGEFRIGLGGTPNPLFPMEANEKIFAEFFTTDPTQLIDLYAVDVNPCTGQRTHRFYGTGDPSGPPFGGVKGRGRFRTTFGTFLPPTREMAVASRGFTGGGPIDIALPGEKYVANGLAAGHYQAPQFDFIFPENLVIGSPQVPLTFQEFPFLVNGSGPYTRFNAGPGATPVGTVGQLSPWPSLSAPPASCTTGLTLLQPPVPSAGATQTVSSGAKVTLDGSQSRDTNQPPLTLVYTWVQSGGPAVSLDGADQAKPTFIAPAVPAGAPPVILTFQLAVCNGYTCSGIAQTTVTVTAASAPQLSLSAVPGVNVLPGQLTTLKAAASGGVAPLKYTFVQTAGSPQTLTQNGNTASFTPTLPLGVAQPAPLTFMVTVSDSATPSPRSATATMTVYVGIDTLTATNVTYSLSKSKLQAAIKSSATPKGAAIITITPIGMTTNVPITTATSANPAVFTAPGHGLIPGSKVNVTIEGATGSWAPVNATFLATVIDDGRFSIPVNATSFGPLTGLLTFTAPLGADVVCTYDPLADTYNLAPYTVNPIPIGIKIRSSYGGSMIAPVTRIR